VNSVPHEGKPVPFSRYLRKQNIEAADMTTRRNDHSKPARHPESYPRPDVPRLGDIPAPERASIEVRLQVTYRVQVPLQPGRLIDVLV
jgi:hypothetical protein